MLVFATSTEVLKQRMQWTVYRRDESDCGVDTLKVREECSFGVKEGVCSKAQICYSSVRAWV